MLLLAVETDWSSLVWFVCLSGLFCLSLISRLYGAGNCWHRLSGVRSKLVNQLSKVMPALDGQIHNFLLFHITLLSFCFLTA